MGLGRWAAALGSAVCSNPLARRSASWASPVTRVASLAPRFGRGGLPCGAVGERFLLEGWVGISRIPWALWLARCLLVEVRRLRLASMRRLASGLAPPGGACAAGGGSGVFPTPAAVYGWLLSGLRGFWVFPGGLAGGWVRVARVPLAPLHP